MSGEILAEVAHEIAAEPLRFVLELVQFVILVVIVWAVAVGFGKHRGFVSNMLAERYGSTYARLGQAAGSRAELTRARKIAGLTSRTARADARQRVGDAKIQAAQIVAQGEAEVDEQAAQILKRADVAIANERAEMELDLRDQLVDVISQATRAVLSERLTPAEQRRMIEESVLATLEDADRIGDSGAVAT